MILHERTKEIKSKYKIKIITAITVSEKNDVIKYKDYLEISKILFDSKVTINRKTRS